MISLQILDPFGKLAVVARKGIVLASFQAGPHGAVHENDVAVRRADQVEEIRDVIGIRLAQI